MREIVQNNQPTIVFASTRHHVEFLHSILQAAGLRTACVYGAMDQVQSLCLWPKCLCGYVLRMSLLLSWIPISLCQHTFKRKKHEAETMPVA